jgi:hypothetical protein
LKTNGHVPKSEGQDYSVLLFLAGALGLFVSSQLSRPSMQAINPVLEKKADEFPSSSFIAKLKDKKEKPITVKRVAHDNFHIPFSSMLLFFCNVKVFSQAKTDRGRYLLCLLLIT